MKESILYIHGKGGAAEEAEHYKPCLLYTSPAVAAAVRDVRGHGLSPGPGGASGHGGVRRVLCPAGGVGWPDPGLSLIHI